MMWYSDTVCLFISELSNSSLSNLCFFMRTGEQRELHLYGLTSPPAAAVGSNHAHIMLKHYFLILIQLI